MEIDFKDSKNITSINCLSVACGSFALEETPLRFETCRERFAYHFTESTSGFYFKHDPNQGDNIAKFLIKTEKILDQPVLSSFAKTNLNSILWVEPSCFWKTCSMRRSLLTLLLRAGNLYDGTKDDYEDSLFYEPYIARTLPAMKRFLFGFTKYTGPECLAAGTLVLKGWKSTFEHKNESQVKELLVSEDDRFALDFDLPSALWV